MVVLVPTGRWLVERWETDVWSDVCTYGFEPRREWARTVLPSRAERKRQRLARRRRVVQSGFAHDGVPLADRT